MPYSVLLTPHFSSTSDVKAVVREMFEDRFQITVSSASDNSPITNVKQEVSVMVMGIRE